jgi:hypothetical protein
MRKQSRWIGAGAVGVWVLAAGLSSPSRAADTPAPGAVLDKAIQALGGEEKLGKAKAVSWTAKGTITFNGMDNAFTGRTVVQGLDHIRQEFEGQFGGSTVKGVTILAGDKGWRKFGDQNTELDKDGLANEKRSAYLAIVPVTILPLKGSGFKTEAAEEVKVGGKPAAGIKATGPDGKEFLLYFDNESGLPVRMVAKVIGFMGEEYTQDTLFSDYQDMGGIKKATKLQVKRDGEKFIDEQISDFKPLESADAKTFDAP